MDVPSSYEAMYTQCSGMVERQIYLVSRGQCPYEERRDIAQDVWLRIVQKDFLQMCRDRYASRGGGDFRQSLNRFVRHVAINHFEFNASRPQHRVTPSESTDDLLTDVLADVAAQAFRSTERELNAREYLDRAGNWLSRRGQYALYEVLVLWRRLGDGRGSTREIALILQLSVPWVRHLKAELRKEIVSYRAQHEM